MSNDEKGRANGFERIDETQLAAVVGGATNGRKTTAKPAPNPKPGRHNPGPQKANAAPFGGLLRSVFPFLP